MNLSDLYPTTVTGTWTVTLTPATSGSITLNAASDLLYYMTVGDMVFYHGRMAVSAVNAPSGTLRISLPFACSNKSELAEVAAGQIMTSNVTYNGQLNLWTEAGLSYVTVIQCATGAGWGLLNANAIAANSELAIAGFYTKA